MADNIPCGKDGFLYPGACNDMCGHPYWQPQLASHDSRTGHECCSTIAQFYQEMLTTLEFMHTASDEDYGKARVMVKDTLLKIKGQL